MFEVTCTTINADELRQMLRRPDAGALVVFESLVRNQTDGRPVGSLEFQAAVRLCEQEGAKLLQETREKFPILEAIVVQRVGHLTVGELIFWIGVAAAHQADAFDACRFLHDEMKLRMKLWKKEYHVAGSA